MKLLLDTHIILWALDDNPKLPNEARTKYHWDKEMRHWQCQQKD